MTSAIELKSPDGTNKVRLEHPGNVSKTINIANLKEESDIQNMINVRTGSAGAFSFRNKLVDGRFDFWYEGTSQTTFTSTNYGSDTMWLNWAIAATGAARTHSRVALAVGELPDVPTAQYFSRTVISAYGTSSSCAIGKSQHIENVSTLAGKTATLSFYAKSDTNRDIMVELEQYYGSNGSNVRRGIGAQKISLTNTWKRYTMTTSIPSLAGTTVSGNNDFLDVVFVYSANSTFASWVNITQQNGTFDIACVQLEEGTVATPFEELPMSVSEQQLNRYYQYYLLGIDTPIGYNPPNAAVSQVFMRNVPMRTIPTMTLTSQNGGATVKSIGGWPKATSTSMIAYHSTNVYYDIACSFTSYTYAAGDFINIFTYVISDARL